MFTHTHFNSCATHSRCEQFQVSRIEFKVLFIQDSRTIFLVWFRRVRFQEGWRIIQSMNAEKNKRDGHNLPTTGDIVMFKDLWLQADDNKWAGAGDWTREWALTADVGVKGLNGEKDWVGVATDNREWAPADSNGVGWWKMLLKCNSEGCSTCVGDSGQSYKNSKVLLFSSEKHALPEIYRDCFLKKLVGTLCLKWNLWKEAREK